VGSRWSSGSRLSVSILVPVRGDLSRQGGERRVVPPKLEYSPTDLGRTLRAAFCGVWV
jgi:hypothetical protein